MTTSDYSQERSYSNAGDSELVVALVGAVGTDIRQVTHQLSESLKHYNYTSDIIKVSSDIIPEAIGLPENINRLSEFKRIKLLMDAGDKARKESEDNSILALGISGKIGEKRNDSPPRRRHAYIIDSLKHPKEVERLREIYTGGVYLIGVYSDAERRWNTLKEKRLSDDQINTLIKRDEDEDLKYGQQTRDTFHLSDFFLLLDENNDRLKNSIKRILSILFGHPYKTPTFDEYAMFLAYSAALRSADLSRQVGAVISNNETIIATGANDCPRFGGGLYWPHVDKHYDVIDDEGGRDYMRGYDANTVEKNRIIDEIINIFNMNNDRKPLLANLLRDTKLNDITEYGRVVHAEMEALLTCSRNNISAYGATLYCTTFPCHNCAKHIIAAGVQRVVYIEPYPKSKAAEFHRDSIKMGFVSSKSESKVCFEPFIGVGPRRFIDLFSMNLGSGYPLKRKDGNGNIINWNEETATLRIQMLPTSYLETEKVAALRFYDFRKGGYYVEENQ